jgi:Tfp pilus assembly protein PilX
MKKLPQHGVVLITTLLVLMVMMFASVGLIRTMDTSVIAVGNMSFRQRAEAPMNEAVERAVATIVAAKDAVPPTLPTNALGALQRDTRQGIPLDLLNRTPSHEKITSRTVDGITLYTMIELACATAVTDLDDVRAPNCTLSSQSNQSSNWVSVEADTPAQPTTLSSPVYRVTVRADGEKNTAVFAQAFVY